MSFPVASVRVLTSPAAFHAALLEGVQASTRQVSLASLYMGGGDLEATLVQGLAQRLREVPGLGFQACFDHGRGLRRVRHGGGWTSTADVVRPAVAAAGDAARVGFFRMPQQAAWWAAWLPPRVVEGVGVQHSKVYVFDDTVIVSGANLSEEYFTSRQDRYVVFEGAPDLARALHGYVGALCDHSVCLVPTGSGDEAPVLGVAPGGGCSVTPPRFPTGSFAAAARDSLLPACVPVATAVREPAARVTPLLQYAVGGVREDEEFTARLLAGVSSGDRLALATGYFNLPRRFVELVLAARCASLRILTAAPSASGFHSASGPSAGIPMGYSEMEREFCAQAAACGSPSQVLEFGVPGQTFHAKGLWYEAASGEMVVAVGSPNFGRRSVERDLELQFVVRDPVPGVAAAFAAERDRLFQAGDAVTPALWQQPDRRLSGWSFKSGLWIAVARRLLAPFL